MSSYNPAYEDDSPGGTPMGPFQVPGGSKCCEDRICACLGGSLQRIAYATERIAEALDDKQKDPCEKIDKCIDKIIDKLKEKLEGPMYTCEKCKDMVRNGLGGTLEYAVRCAGVACDDCDTVCTMGDPSSEGKCCNYCGSPKCKCKDGSCVPVEEEPKQQFKGWCNRETGVTAVTGPNESAPGPGYVVVAISDSRESAAAQAIINCQRTEEPPRPPESPRNPPPITSGGLGTCSPFDYTSGAILSNLRGKQILADVVAGRASAGDTIRQVGFDGLNVRSVADTLYGLFRGYLALPGFIASDIAPRMAAALGCNNPQFVEAIMGQVALQTGGASLGVDLSQYALPWVYAANSACRTRFQETENAMATYLANGMSKETLDSIYAINGFCNQVVNEDLQAQKSKPIPLQLSTMRRRGMIGEEMYHSKMRQLGYLNVVEVEQLFQLTEQVPTETEIIRMMVRDSDDESLAKRFNLDEGFTTKYGRQLRKWSEAQGVSEQHAKYLWRAHWSIPSPTALMNFWHRLRYKDEFGGKAKLEQDIKEALIQQDILPYWHKAYLATSFRPFRLVDIRRAFQIGSMNEDEMRMAYLDLGYSDDSADKMSAFTKRLRDRAILSERPVKLWLRLSLNREQAFQQLKADGVPDDVINKALSSAEPDFIKSPYSAAFARGDITAAELREALASYGVSGPAIDNIIRLQSLKLRNHRTIPQYRVGTIERAEAKASMMTDGMMSATAEALLKETDIDIKLEFVKNCKAGIKRRYLLGELDKQEAQNELTKFGLTNTRAREAVGWWECEMKSGEKHVSASTLCEWLQRGAITSTNFVDRLKKIGYTEMDAAMMLEDCLIRLNTQAIAKAKREAKEQISEQSKTARLLEKQARDTYRYNQQLQRNRQQGAKTRANREKTLLTAVDKYHSKCNCSLYQAATTVKSEQQYLMNEYALTIDESLQILVLAADNYTGVDGREYTDITREMAQAAVTAALNGVPAEIQMPPSTNGSTVPSG